LGEFGGIAWRSRRLMTRARCLFGFLLLGRTAHITPFVVFVFAASTFAQDARIIANPREFGLDLPPGAISPGENQTVTTTDDNGQPTIGRIHVRVGAGAIILLP